MFKKLKKKVNRAIIAHIAARYDKPLAPPSQRELVLVEEFRRALQALGRSRAGDGASVENEWLDNAVQLEKLASGDDPRRFLRWDVIHKTMFVGQAPYVTPELEYLQNRPDWQDRWEHVIQELPAGHPTPYWKYPQSSGNCIHHAYHWAKFEETTGLSVKEANLIFEFGGGYGSMCRLAHRLGFQGRYLLYDLPVYSALQQFYLQLTDATILTPESFREGCGGTLCTGDLQVLQSALSDSTRLRNAIFVATWSLSESPVHLRHIVLDLIAPFQTFLIAYQAGFAGTDNVAFFRQWSERRDDIEWTDILIEHLPKGNRYLLGRSKEGRRQSTARLNRQEEEHKDHRPEDLRPQPSSHPDSMHGGPARDRTSAANET
ncbi:MAG: hypothetical protein JW955_11475 [Sedimentisphaerales bacterium]|nr:hypothetical protein [Sedimentisphaerales bacterium]